MLNQHQTIKDNIEKYNKSFPLVDYLFTPYIKGRKNPVEILDIGSGPFSKIGQSLPDMHGHFHFTDKQDFSDFYTKYGVKPIFPIEYQDMEHLTYPTNTFDLVHCANALDHTKDAYKAVKEMIRVCKANGFIYIECYLDQLDTGHLHYWNVRESGVFSNKDGEQFDLKNLGFTVTYEENPLGRRYSKIIAVK